MDDRTDDDSSTGVFGTSSTSNISWSSENSALSDCKENEEQTSGANAYRILLTCLIVSLFFLTGCGMSCVSVFLSEIYEFLKMFNPSIEKKYVRLFALLSRGLGLVISTPIVGRIYAEAKYPTKWYHLNVNHVMGFMGVACYSVQLIFVPLVTFAPITLFLNFFWGLGMSIMMVGGTILPKAIWKSQKITAAVSQTMYFFLAFGATLNSMIIGKTVKKYDDWSPRRKIFVVYWSLLIFFLIPALIGFIPPPKFHSEKKESDESSSEKQRNFFRRIYDKLRNLDLLRIIFVFCLSLSLFFHSSSIKSFGNMTTSYAEDRGWCKVDSTYATSVFYFFFTISRLLSVLLFLFIKSSYLVTFYLLSTMTGIILMFFLRDHDVVIWMGLAIIGFVMSPCFAGLTVLPANFGLNLSAVELALMLTPNGLSAAMAGMCGYLMGWNIDVYFFVNIFFSVVTVLMFSATVVTGYLLKKKEYVT